MMRRTGFKPKWPEKPVTTRVPAVTTKPDTSRFRMMEKVSAMPSPMPKENVVSCEAYRRLVAALPCKRCGIHGYSQAAHPNMNKGMGIKTDDRLCFPLCTVHPDMNGNLVQGCHEKFDQGGKESKYARRVVEEAMGQDTRRLILLSGKWPKDLPVWQ